MFVVVYRMFQHLSKRRARAVEVGGPSLELSCFLCLCAINSEICVGDAVGAGGAPRLLKWCIRSPSASSHSTEFPYFCHIRGHYRVILYSCSPYTTVSEALVRRSAYNNGESFWPCLSPLCRMWRPNCAGNSDGTRQTKFPRHSSGHLKQSSGTFASPSLHLQRTVSMWLKNDLFQQAYNFREHCVKSVLN